MNKINEYSFHTKDDMLNKLRAYTHNPDDDNIRIKNQVYQILLHCPELLYAIHDAELDCLPMQRKKQGESQNSADSDIFNKKFPPRRLSKVKFR